MTSHPGSNTSLKGTGQGAKPDPGPAPVGPAVHGPAQQPVEPPRDPGPAPVGPAVDERGEGR